MSASIAEINARHLDNFEKLLAASSKIIQLEELVSAADTLMAAQKVQIEALKAVSEATIGMLEAARPMFPDELLPTLDGLLIKGRKVIALVKS
jgi:hypothetical protein